jgi:hypothetical protein
MRYGTGDPFVGDPKSTWSALYAAVWHLAEASGAADAAGRGLDMMVTGTAPESAAGMVGNARLFLGSATQQSL